MEAEVVDGVRRFARLVTQCFGALDDRYLSLDRPLGQARVLWEIGCDGREVGALRLRLGLDSAQLSRTLRALEADGLVTVRPDGRDARVRVAELTRRGVAEWRELDNRSVAAVADLLDRLDPVRRDRFAQAAAELERLLLASSIEVTQRPPTHAAARAALRAYADELTRRFQLDVNPAIGSDLTPPDGVLLVATLHGEPVGCGGLRFHAGKPPEIKRLWAAPSVRGCGLGRRLLAELEQLARGCGARSVRLDTHRTLTEAIALYRSAGYREIAAYNDNPHAHHWFSKRLR